MVHYGFDLSEYQDPASGEDDFLWDGCSDLTPDFFTNTVSWNQGEKKLYLNICPAYEFEAMFMLYDELGYPIPEKYEREFTAEEVEGLRNDLRKLREKFGSAFHVRPSIPLYPDSFSELRVNAFSGTEITVPLGEGLLNFCYADFTVAFGHCEETYRALSQKPAPLGKIHGAEEGVIRLYELYEQVFPTLSEVFYSSLYTASIPPQFANCTKGAMEYYRRYLSTLQSEFLELIAFCLDKDYRPGVLGRLYPSERYSLWCRIRGRSACHIRRETFDPDSHKPHGLKMPWGIDLETVDCRQEVVLTPEQEAFVEEYGLQEAELRHRYMFPCFISTSYGCSNLRDMLYLEFTKILETGVEFQRCRRCGRYFIVKGNYHGQYCDRIAEGETRTCQQLAAQDAYLHKLKDNGGQNALNVYQKYYKRYFARVRAGSLKREKLRQWQYEAVGKRDACLAGMITLEEFTGWLESSMPNRVKKARPSFL